MGGLRTLPGVMILIYPVVCFAFLPWTVIDCSLTPFNTAA